nr:F-box domain-containing protein [Tanacetum cinerariifolium]
MGKEFRGEESGYALVTRKTSSVDEDDGPRQAFDIHRVLYEDVEVVGFKSGFFTKSSKSCPIQFDFDAKNTRNKMAMEYIAKGWNVFRFYGMPKRAGERVGSRLMKANAWHHRADAISLLDTLIGVGGSILVVSFLDPLAVERAGRFGTKGLALTFVASALDSDVLNQAMNARMGDLVQSLGMPLGLGDQFNHNHHEIDMNHPILALNTTIIAIAIKEGIIVSVPTPYSSRLLSFNMDEEPIIEVDDIGHLMDTTLQVYHRTHEEFQNLGVEANSEVMMQVKVFDQKGIDHTRYTISFTNAVNVPKQGGVFGDGGIWTCNFLYRLSHGLSLDIDNPIQTTLAYREHMMDDFRKRISSSGPLTPLTLYTRPSTRLSYSARTFGSAMNVRKAECSNCKFLAKKIKSLEAKIKILEGTLEMERHPENHTIVSDAILYELYNGMRKIGLE